MSHWSTTSGIAARTIATAALAAAMLALPGRAQAPGGPVDLPFVPGEDLTYTVKMGRFGESGTGRMYVTGPEQVRGRSALRLHFGLKSRVAGVATVVDSTCSWLDPEAFVSLRYRKHERSPLSSGTEAVELFPDRGVWESGEDTSALASPDPLDELSFLYYIRTLPLREGDEYRIERHFDPARNPVVVRVLRRERVEVPAGAFDAVVVEMRVTSPRRWGGHRTLQMALSDDAHRTPVRFEMSMPVVGTVVLSLESGSPLAHR